MSFATPLRTLLFLVPVSVLASGCVVSCNGHDDPCDAYDSNCYGGGYSASGGQGQVGGGDAGGQGGAGGGESCDQSVVVCPCTEDSKCAEGLSCVGDKCLSACGFDFQCADAHVCADGQCVPVCNSDGLCDPGYACIGGGCLPDPLNPLCTTPTDCDGLPCVDGFCTTACLSNADCALGTLCEAATGTCFPDLGPTPLCSAELACPGQGQTCSSEGFCRYECDSLEACKLIDARFDACDASVCKTDAELNPECTLGLPCNTDQFCVSNECVP